MNTMIDDFETDSYRFLKNAKEFLATNSTQGLFYAALNLRFGIEFRIRQYASSMQEYLSYKRNIRSTSSLYKSIESAFKINDRIIKLSIAVSHKENVICILYHTPITSKINKLKGVLGEYLHITEETNTKSTVWLNQFKNYLIETSTELENVLRGKLLAPPIGNGINMNYVSTDEECNNWIKFYVDKGVKKFLMKIDYVDHI